MARDVLVGHFAVHSTNRVLRAFNFDSMDMFDLQDDIGESCEKTDRFLIRITYVLMLFHLL